MIHAQSFDALLAAAIRETVREDWEKMASDPDIRPVGQPFGERMEVILSGKSRRTRAVMKKIGVGILVALSLLAMLGMAIRPVREAIFEMFVEKHGTELTVRYSAPDGGQGPGKIEDYKEPTVPEGCVRIEVQKNDFSFLVRYIWNDASVRFRQRLPGTGTYTVSGRGTATYEADINGHLGQVVVSREGGLETVHIFWFDGSYDYVLRGNLPAEEMLELARSVK